MKDQLKPKKKGSFKSHNISAKNIVNKSGQQNQNQLTEGERQRSQGQQNSSNNENNTLNRGDRLNRIDFDSCISTEEAFFNGEEHKLGALRNAERSGGSNPQEDRTPKAKFNRTNQQTVDTFAAASRPTTLGFNPNRQRTQRWSPKGRSMARPDKDAIDRPQGANGTAADNGALHSSQKLLKNLNEDSNGSKKLNSELSPNSKNRLNSSPKKKGELKIVTKQQSNVLDNDFGKRSPLLRKQSINASGLLAEDSSFFDKESVHLSRHDSRHSIASPSEDSRMMKKVGSFRRLNNGNQSNKLVNQSSSSKDRRTANQQRQPSPIGRTESFRHLNQPPPVISGAQGDMRLDMKFGWRPQFNERDLHRKEAIAIKLTYPNNQNLWQQSVRCNQLASELYRMNKNLRKLKNESKKNFVPDFPSRLVYQGYRPTVSLELHLRYGQKASFIEDSQYYDVLIPKSIKAKALENGLHRQTPRSPVDADTLKTLDADKDNPASELSFDSMFESGNLDLAIQVQPREYNLYLKPDTNTKGYCNWFFFKVKRKPDAKGRFPARRYQFNIMNMYKKKILYKQEAKPLACFSEIHHKGFIMQELENVAWKTSNFSNIGYGLVTQRQVAAAAQNSDDEGQIEAIREQTLVPAGLNMGGTGKQKFFCLSFDFDFPSGNEFVYIAQSIPYPYTFLQKTIKTCAKLDQACTTLTRSLGGLSIPMLTITNNVINVAKKRTVIICGRIHPGETNSSWVLHGMIDYLISKDASHLRDNLIFKIVPMVNPDGVVAGNYRTSFIGKDLNRLYLHSDEPAEQRYSSMEDILKPEITAMQQLIKGCKADESKGILAFIDVHHHSAKRGAFMFGPSYQMHHSKYQEVRVLPKLISLMLPQMFRFQSCKFKNQSYKENCARLFCDREAGITYSFCLECSQQGYFAQDDDINSGRGTTVPARYRRVKYFDQNSLMQLGRKICEAIYILNEMSDVQDQKRDAIQKRRKLRMKKSKKGIVARSMAGKSNIKNSKAGDQSSMFGATDFDVESEYRNQSSNMSATSQDFLQGGINPKMGIKTFIAQMIGNKTQIGSQPELKSDNSQGALRNKTKNRPLTHFGSEDAVSERSEKDEESMSGSDGGSSAQDLSENEQDNVLNQILDQLMPNRVKKINPVTAQITITQGVKPELVQKPPMRRNLKSANRVITIDKKMVQKEQLMIPRAVLDLQVQNQTGGRTMLGLQEQPIAGIAPFSEENQSKMQIAPANNVQQSQTKAKQVENALKAMAKNNPQIKSTTAQNFVQGVYQPGPSHGYVSQRFVQNKKRIQSSRYGNKNSNNTAVDLFANPRNVPVPAHNRQILASTTQRKANHTNMKQISNATAAYFGANQMLHQDNNLPSEQQMKHPTDLTRQLINRQSLKTAGNHQHSQSQTWNEVLTNHHDLASTNGNLESRPSYTNMHKRHGSSVAIDTGIKSGGGVASNNFKVTRNGKSAVSRVATANNNRKTNIEITEIPQQNTTSGHFQKVHHGLESEWTFSRQNQQFAQQEQETQSSFASGQIDVLATNYKQRNLSSQHTPLKTNNTHQIKLLANSNLKKSGAAAQHSYMKTAEKTKTNFLSSSDFMQDNTTVAQQLNFAQSESQTMSPNGRQQQQQIDRTNLPLAQGGFFHRNQIVGGHQDLDHGRSFQQNMNKTPNVIIKTRTGPMVQSPGALAFKRNSAIDSLQKKTQSINRISHKRSSQQLPADFGQHSPFTTSEQGNNNNIFAAHNKTANLNGFASAAGLYSQVDNSVQQYQQNQNLQHGQRLQVYNQFTSQPNVSPSRGTTAHEPDKNLDLNFRQMEARRHTKDPQQQNHFRVQAPHVINSHQLATSQTQYNSPLKTPIVMKSNNHARLNSDGKGQQSSSSQQHHQQYMYKRRENLTTAKKTKALLSSAASDKSVSAAGAANQDLLHGDVKGWSEPTSKLTGVRSGAPSALNPTQQNNSGGVSQQLHKGGARKIINPNQFRAALDSSSATGAAAGSAEGKYNRIGHNRSQVQKNRNSVQRQQNQQHHKF